MKIKQFWVGTFLLLLLLTGSCFLYRSTPVTLRTSLWTHNLLRNWKEFGVLQFQGKMPINPGGFPLPNQPHFYPGHRPFMFYPAYLLGQTPIHGAVGCDDETPFFLALSLVIGFGVWRLLGGGPVAITAAALVVFSPAYIRLAAILDPVPVPVLLAIPFLYWTRHLLAKEHLTAGGVGVLGVVVALYSLLNWTSVIGFGIVLAYLVVALRGKWKRVAAFTLLVGLAGAAVMAASLISKASATVSTSSTDLLSQWFNMYLFGPKGYDGQSMTWTRASIRLTVANGVILFPLWLLLLWAGGKVARQDKRIGPGLGLALLPLLVSILAVAGLRNYFAHHPWMAGPVLICGIVFSLRLLLDRFAQPKIAPAATAAPRAWWGAGLALGGGFIFGYILVVGLGANSAVDDSIARFARKHTDRHDLIFYSPKDDPWFVQYNPERLAEIMDRALIPLSESNELPKALPVWPGARYQLSTKASWGNQPWLARTETTPLPGGQLTTRLLDWYRTHIAKRVKGDRLEAEGALYLYKRP